MSLSAHDAIIVDNQRAHDFAAKYMQAVNGELYARGLKLTSAIQKFTKFLSLEAIPPWYETIINVALPVLSVMAPELYLAKFLGEEEKNVKAALAISSALGNKTAKVITVVQQAKELGDKAEKVKGAYEKAKKVKEDVVKLVEADDAPGAKDLANLDASKAIVNALIESSRRAFKIWSDALDVLDKELEIRLSDIKHPVKESLEQLAKRLLQPPTPFRADELDQIENLYLFEMIKAYARTAVTVTVRIRYDRAVGSSDIDRSINNLNNNQQATIVAYFGPKAQRGAIFSYPPVFDIYVLLKMWGVKETTSVYEPLMHLDH